MERLAALTPPGRPTGPQNAPEGPGSALGRIVTRTRTMTRARACTGKKAHATRQAAQEHLDRLIAGGASPDRVKIYTFPADGSHLHVGHVHPGRR